jgi:hypothetical protein
MVDEDMVAKQAGMQLVDAAEQMFRGAAEVSVYNAASRLVGGRTNALEILCGHEPAEEKG